jgi:8-oxo-dGTP pyrophosphatase MutT (NUDIX family)
MKVKETFPRPVVCIVAERVNNGTHEILIQRRSKTGKSVAYPGIWELPQGKIRTGESIEEAAYRELKEETTLKVISISHEHEIKKKKILNSNIVTFESTITVIDKENNFIGFGIVVDCEKGRPKETPEASSHQWIDKKEARKLIVQHQIFPLNVPIIRKYFGIE